MGPAAGRPGIALAESSKVSPSLVKGAQPNGNPAQKTPFWVQSWRWYSGDSVKHTPYPFTPINSETCTPPLADTNPALCSLTLTPNTFGVLEIDAIVNGVRETRRKNVTVSDSARVCDGQVLKPWGRISSRYKVRERIRRNTEHRGSDQAAPEGTPVYAAEAGIVEEAKWGDSSGWRVIVRGALISFYFHLKSKPLVEKGAPVSTNTLLGFVGSTGSGDGGPHLHFQQHRGPDIWKDGFAPSDTEVEPCYY